MAIILSTKRNLQMLKSLLMSDFKMKSAHASEVIAALSGFSSHASFLSESRALKFPKVYDVDFDLFEARSLELGYDAESSEYLQFIYRYIDWPEPAWRLFRKADQVSKNAWFEHCKNLHLPYMLISKARKYYSVEWDHVSAPTEYDELFEQHANQNLIDTMFRTYQMIANRAQPKSYFYGSPLVSEVTGLSASAARQIANAFARLLFPGNLQSTQLA